MFVEPFKRILYPLTKRPKIHGGLSVTNRCKKKSVEQFSSIPYLAALANCMLWVFYGLPVVQPDTILISTINGVGVFVVKLLAILAGEVVLMAMVVTLVLTVVHTHDVRSLIVGILSIIFCVCMYASPLSVMV
ncbi:Bidirectional sugar transporter SWEET6b [Dendrobium catenatum]|uniref:Bidirectional sugar transporter SWEET6b n=1 Tax=Dendrobium catenatum TaxID=906689 RepID=A0A2I0XFD7_9ASPA|nr:Bidirectional sugar transporter SWEET6b [Dendrobium catenatum]